MRIKSKFDVLSKVEIRAAVLDDAQALSTLIQQNAETTLSPHYSDAQMQVFLRYYRASEVEKNLLTQDIFCAEIAGQSVGRAASARRVCRTASARLVCRAASARLVGTVGLAQECIVGFYTARSHLGLGIGKQLMQHIEAHARAKGLLQVKLWASPAATSFYRHIGYQILAIEQKNYLGIDFEETLMQKRL